MAKSILSHPAVPKSYQLRPNSPKLNYFPGGGRQNALTTRRILSIIQRKNKSVYDHILTMQLASGARASEIINLKHRDVMPPGIIRIPGAKGSNARYLYYPEILQYYNPDRTVQEEQLLSATYNTYYRWCDRNGIAALNQRTGTRRIVTHLSRHTLLQAIWDYWHPTRDELARVSGHKSIKSLSYYINQLKEV